MIPKFIEIHPFQDGGSHDCLLCGQPRETHAPEVIQALREEVAAQQRENKRLKERLEKSESRRTHWDAVTLTNYEFTKTQLAEAVTLLRGCTSAGCAFVIPEPDTFGTADVCDCRHKARDFLAKAKT